MRSAAHILPAEYLRARSPRRLVTRQVQNSPFCGCRSEQRATEALLPERCEALILLGLQVPARLEDLAAQLPVICVARRLRRPPPARRGGPDRRRRRGPPGRRSPRCPSTTRHRPHRRRLDSRRRRPTPQLPHRHTSPRPGQPPRVLPGGPTGKTAPQPPAPCARRPRPTAILASRPLRYRRFNLLLRSGVSLPGEMSVVGFDDSHPAGWPTSTSPPSPGHPASPTSPLAGHSLTALAALGLSGIIPACRAMRAAWHRSRTVPERSGQDSHHRDAAGVAGHGHSTNPCTLPRRVSPTCGSRWHRFPESVGFQRPDRGRRRRMPPIARIARRNCIRSGTRSDWSGPAAASRHGCIRPECPALPRCWLICLAQRPPAQAATW